MQAASLRRRLPLVGAIVILVATFGARADAAMQHRSTHRTATAVAPCPVGQTPRCPSKDPFYAAPRHIARLANGAVIRTRAVSLAPPNAPLVASARTVIYKSVDTHSAAVADVTTVLVPVTPWTSRRPRPLLSYQEAEDSLGRQCSPSYSMSNGTNGTNDNELAENSIIQSALAMGWLVAVPDYEGPDEQYVAGVQAGHAVLDGIRAVEHLRAYHLSHRNPVGLMGYSGGGLASAWASELKASYAHALHIVGSAEGGVPSDIPAVMRQIDGGPFSGIEFAASEGLSRAYPKARVPAVLNAAGRAVFAKIADECIGTLTGQYALKRLNGYTRHPHAFSLPRIRRLLRKVHLEKHTPRFPIYDYHSTNDELVPYAQDKTMVAYYCHHHATVEHVTYPTEHVSGIVAGFPGALRWLQGRFADKKAPDNCPGH
jgi:pimeloyl-ACP methyl ester carboxylesterase